MTTTTDIERNSVTIPLRHEHLAGELAVPVSATGIVIFVHGSGSGRHSPRNSYVAGELHACGVATLLMDLLTPREHEADLQSAEYRFDIDLLADRVLLATRWVESQPALQRLRVGYFGASTGAAAALTAAAVCPGTVGAIVSRGGRPDLAPKESLCLVHAPTLLIVGELDVDVIELNRHAMDHLHCQKRLEIVPGAGHLFEEPGAIAQVAHLAQGWFHKHLNEPVQSPHSLRE
jgi:dienelactone hydrolase